MLRHIFAFELRYWLRSWMLWVFLLIIAALIFSAASSDHITIGGALSNTNRNAPFVIENFYSIIGLLTLLMTTAFVNSAAARDFSFRTHEIIFSTPVRRRDYLVGRFAGSTLVSIVPMLGVSIGILLAKYMPWVEPDRWGAISWAAHLKGILVFAVPNGFFMAAVLFAIAVLARNEIVSFIGALLLLVGYLVSDALVTNVEHERIAALLDPFAIRTFTLATKYWTVAEKNTHTIGFDGLLLWNRVIWLAVGGLIFAFAYSRFSFSEKRRKVKRAPAKEAVVESAPISGRIPLVLSRSGRWPQFVTSVRIHLLGVVKSTSFIVLLLAALLNCVPDLALSAREAYGNSSFPVTYWVLDIISGTLYMFVIAMITYYAGVLVWKDRDNRMDEIQDALPVPEWLSYASRLVALIAIVMLILLTAMVSGVVVQTALGYHRYQFGLYLSEMFVRDGSLFVLVAVLAFFMHTLAPNKYVGYFVYIVFLIINFFVWRPLNVATYMVQFAHRPDMTYSDFYGDAPFRAAWNWFTVYWLLFSGLLSIAAVLLWPRGKPSGWRERFREAGLRFRGVLRPLALACLALFAATGVWIAYNTMVLNRLRGPKDEQRLQAEYEKTYKPFDNLPQPRVRSVKYHIDIYPESRRMVMRAEQVIENPYSQPVSQIHFSLNRNYTTSIDIPGAALVKDDTRLDYRIYKFSEPMQLGERRTMHFTVGSLTRGFENNVSNRELVQNGTFFNNSVGPIIGYRRDRELDDPVERRKFGLKEIDMMPALERTCTDDCRETYLGGHSDWVDVDTVIGTSPDQIAIAPGSRVREWRGEGGRHYYEYKLDHPSLNFYSFISARYQVACEQWNGIPLEVYYLKEQPWNVQRMLNSMRKSLDYYTRNFGPYGHKEARIIEFPRVARFAQAFPGTMPYSEAIGFIANLNHPDDIDTVFYIVAHEMGHQWWAHQVIGADMEGATLLSETMAQYSALMVMEKEYGHDMMRKFLKFEMDRYLRARGQERMKERPLLTVESGQGYVHYQKGSVTMYYLKEMIGEDAVNRALRHVIEQYAYAPSPYPTSWALIDALRAETPPQYQYLLKELFEDITLFSNRTLSATAHKRADGKYDVTIDIETRKFQADAKGNETEVPVNDWIDIGAFAKPDKGKKYGRTLYRERLHLAGVRSSHTFTTAELPENAGVDPFLLLVDRVPDDNMKAVSQ